MITVLMLITTITSGELNVAQTATLTTMEICQQVQQKLPKENMVTWPNSNRMLTVLSQKVECLPVK